MSLNEGTAVTLDSNPKRERLCILVLSTVSAAPSVVLVGNVTFIGLLAGHITRQLLGGDHRIDLPSSLLIEMIIFLIADTIGCVLLVDTGIPARLVVAIIGTPYFLHLMIRTT